MAQDKQNLMQRIKASNTQSKRHVGHIVASCPKVSLEIGVFFDGTGNNGYNTQLGRDDSSDYTNIWKLHDLYFSERQSDPNECGGFKTKYDRIYMEGIGTKRDEPNDKKAMATGMGELGVENIVYEACIEVGKRINRLSPNVEPKEVILDVFGFSRGAAAARYFVNCFNAGKIYYNKVNLLDVIAYGALRSLNDKSAQVPKDRNIKIRFVGIFDTVAAVGLANNAYNYDVNMHLKEGQSAKRIVHLTADPNDEFRTNFRLNENIPGGGVQKVFPGAHSDVGGGYYNGGGNLGEKEEVRMLHQISKTYNSKHIAEKKRQDVLQKERARLASGAGLPADVQHVIKLGLADRPHIQVIATEVKGFFIPPSLSRGYQDFSFKVQYLMTRTLSNALSKIPLHYMHQEAQKAGVPLNDFLTGNKQTDIPQNDQTLVLAQQVLMTGNPVDPVTHKKLRKTYIHCSSQFSGITEDLTAWASNRTDSGYHRTTYKNDPSKAK